MNESNYRTRYKRFLEKLKQARIEAGLTQREAARALGKPQSFISKCESGERRLDFVELELLAELYGKDLEFFRTEDKDKNGKGNS